MYHSSAQMMIPRTTPCVKVLIIMNLVCWFLLVSIVQRFFMKTDVIYHLFGFVPSAIDNYFFIWQFFTYMFIHSAGLFHILFNMMVLWMFGSELEQLWGKKFFLTYYIICGVGSAIVYFVGVKLYFIFSGVGAVMDTPVVGASGAIFGLLLAYGWIFGDRLVLFMFVFPMKARTFTILIAAVELMTILQSGFGTPVANLAHLGGLLSGFLFLRFKSVSQKLQQGSSLFRRRSRLKVLNGRDG
ncbi:MAG: rhomboid family intramembrane serine protease [Oligoflexia bacterium]|nr:rhomboid family intramembrane serine protease [Oligoflexia bacterium]